MAVALSFTSLWEHMPSELITCLEGPIKIPSDAPKQEGYSSEESMCSDEHTRRTVA